MVEKGMMHHGGEGPMYEIWEMMTEEQKRKLIAMKLDMKLQWMQIKVDEMQKIIELKKKAIENIKMVQEMVKKGK